MIRDVRLRDMARATGVQVPTGVPRRATPGRRPRAEREPAHQSGREPAPPVKQPTWEWYIPIYFWLGGMSAGAWLAATAEDVAGEGDRDAIRIARYVSSGTLLGGTALLIADLGRPERFVNMLRIVRPRSTMSLGSWGLAAYATAVHGAALLQAAEDGLLGTRPRLARMSRGAAGVVLHAAALPLALFVGSYTGVLLGTTSNPSWSRRVRVFGPLYAASAASSGLAAVTLLLEGVDESVGVRLRLSRAESIALAAELTLAMVSWNRVRRLPSTRREGAWRRLARALTLGGGIALPLLMQLARAWRPGAREEIEEEERRRRRSRRRGAQERWRDETHERDVAGIAASVLALGGSLALRYLTTRGGYRSARTPADTWAVTGGAPPAMPAMERGRGARSSGTGSATRRGVPARASRRTRGGELDGYITVVQEDRVRLVDARGRGYLFVVKPRRASHATLERWRDARTMLHVWYEGAPDIDGKIVKVREVVGRGTRESGIGNR